MSYMNIEQTTLNKKKDINIGIRILRVCLSFTVVMDHFYNIEKLQKFYHILYYHIPTFFLISFYFTFKTLTSFNIDKMKLRLERLLIPYFSWCIISWIIKNIYFHIFKRECRHSLIDFVINLINGHIFNVVLWFQIILILLTIIFIIIILSFKTNYFLILQILYFLSYFLQYSEINYTFFRNNFDSHSRSTFGRFVEALPNAITGFFLSSIDIIGSIKKKNFSIKVIFFSLITIILISKYEIFGNIKTFKYGGLRLNIGAICIFLLFSLIPGKVYRYSLVNNFILQITNYTGGIYFIHYLIGTGYLFRAINIIQKGTLLSCFIIYLISYIICFISLKFLGNTKLKHLFN